MYQKKMHVRNKNNKNNKGNLGKNEFNIETSLNFIKLTKC